MIRDRWLPLAMLVTVVSGILVCALGGIVLFYAPFGQVIVNVGFTLLAAASILALVLLVLVTWGFTHDDE